MIILALDTSSSLGAVAVVEAGDNPYEATTRSQLQSFGSNAHGESVMPLVEKALMLARTSVHEVDLIAVGIGPGSFTGTRIALAMAKGLAFAANKPLIGVESFVSIAFAAGLDDGETIGVTIDARKSEVYAALVERKGTSIARVSEPVHVKPTNLQLHWEGRFPKVLVGDGARLVDASCVRAACVPSAASIGAMGAQLYMHRNKKDCPMDSPDTRTNISLLEPLYVRAADITMPKVRPIVSELSLLATETTTPKCDETR